MENESRESQIAYLLYTDYLSHGGDDAIQNISTVLSSAYANRFIELALRLYEREGQELDPRMNVIMAHDYSPLLSGEIAIPLKGHVLRYLSLSTDEREEYRKALFGE